MSNTIRYDSLLVRHLALELTPELTGKLTAAWFERDRHAFVLATDGRALRWNLRTGVIAWSSDLPTESVPLPRHALIASVEALADERILRLHVRGGSRANAAQSFIVELLPNASNALALDGADRVLKALSMRSGSRMHVRGQPYAPPSTRARLGDTQPINASEWNALLRDVRGNARAAVLLERVAYMSAINADAVLMADDLEAAHARYLELWHSAPRPCVLRAPPGQPYGHPLWQESVEPYPTLLAAIAAATDRPPVSADAQYERRIERERKKLEKLEREGAEAAVDAQRLRTEADLLLASAHEVPRGASTVELRGFDGQSVRLELDPALSAIDNAQQRYAQARKRDRAAERLPLLIAETRENLLRLEDTVRRARAGELVPIPAGPTKPAAPRAAAEEKLPYRRYRTSGGLEVRVGKNSRSNDELTLRHSSPNDIWMHARAVGGAHVVLRWDDPKGHPPRQDLIEAAALAALHSRARHSGTVPIDWTRRKYVRKPRGVTAGTVVVERVKTLFVQPNAGLEEKLRW